jgi:hypothetical protein
MHGMPTVHDICIQPFFGICDQHSSSSPVGPAMCGRLHPPRRGSRPAPAPGRWPPRGHCHARDRLRGGTGVLSDSKRTRSPPIGPPGAPSEPSALRPPAPRGAVSQAPAQPPTLASCPADTAPRPPLSIRGDWGGAGRALPAARVPPAAGSTPGWSPLAGDLIRFLVADYPSSWYPSLPSRRGEKPG